METEQTILYADTEATAYGVMDPCNEEAKAPDGSSSPGFKLAEIYKKQDEEKYWFKRIDQLGNNICCNGGLKKTEIDKAMGDSVTSGTLIQIIKTEQ